MTAKNKTAPRVRLGDYIEECDERNTEGKYTLDDVRGISIEKKLIFTKANMDGITLEPYKLLKPLEFGYVTVTSRNGDKITLAINREKKTFLVSSSYKVFKAKSKLLPEYLYLLLSRGEFDRYARFNSWGSARETFDWEEMCRINIPLPSIEVQQEVVDTYTGLKRLAEENEALIAPLTEASQAFIVDCQKKYPTVELGKYIEECDERNTEGKYTLDDVRGISTDKKFISTKANMDGVSLTSYKEVNPSGFVYVADTSRRGDKIALAHNSTEQSLLVSSVYTVFKTKDGLLPEYLYLLLSRGEFDRYARFNSWGSARETFDWTELCRVSIALPPPEVQQSIVNLYHYIEEAKKIACEARAQLQTLCPALIQYAEHH
ncbi:restriction endonuclease subunit S [Porphyromonas circumdentaria]|uniref:Type I restriction enzyme, S subunit n=1 Tax=Porphyromonas circumdentaria TaxID=29524 RepID=A0A1T4KNF4_9PORP|nr:restriction endonuclease subunit S [Porphyromonas circumdentaria]MBB6274971.1 type I restriction enzyme S subunit [Porphyromonas circumdentaria]SJZ43931.1 type I restriction enzyme, S subunit [Porphyromonas circumdentaria]